jgi:hypothetical protein
MILWLASFRRSGKALLRMVLRQAFGLHSCSIHNHLGFIGSNPEARDAVGHLFIEGSIQEFYQNSLYAAGWVPTKTHDPPMDQAPAIYVVRDGRAALVSCWNYLQRVRQRHDLTLGDVIRGESTKFGSWSIHLRRWAPHLRPRTLLLRYEDLLDNANVALGEIASFTGREPVVQWENNFQRMNAAFPNFFNAGSNAENIEQMTPQDRDVFWSLHGECMKTFGYANEARPSA